ncbi:uncharacterized protein L3040_000941 [Drepanopeziza brunnea f. sp. 'multigermtubi']|uniref:Cation transporter n=1 Tax=Marssonina brunnea f. sp. multigermtubi (strain MB_m1) TaxID=1072389 RepID=K1X6X3_MARBU|nr:cation transporter [Drepanopeziza brunnea f. sp. 'multigermtubi' MB_m1]EKD20836.1 cation transporter [Drepanopeziza brunnea f. sp. 'multigermtubi' MB_m1]KAJ5054675.1 hypothetical protein L3040_000941 [Drepanopeziza brunnea f. sp. 'multigermtubi']
MWKPPMNFITFHYMYIIVLSILGYIIIYPHKNMPSTDAFFFGVSAATESGLNTIDVKDLKLYQQLVVLYFFPILGNIGFINIVVVLVRLMWFEKRLRKADSESRAHDAENGTVALPVRDCEAQADLFGSSHRKEESGNETSVNQPAKHINFGPEPEQLREKSARDANQDPERLMSDEEGASRPKSALSGTELGRSFKLRKTATHSSQISNSAAVAHVASSIFVVGASGTERDDGQTPRLKFRIPFLSRQATVGRNSNFHRLTIEDRLRLGGIEYSSLRLLLKIVLGFFFGLHIFGAICLVIWIQYAPAKYTDYVQESGQNKIWWAFYSAQTMANNLGFTLTPDSMISFRDATFPMIVMTFLAYAGNTFYPILLRLVIWMGSKLVSKTSSLREPLQFLLDHPRRCYTLLFPSHPTWVLFGILVVLNVVDVLLIILLDLDNETVTVLPPGPRVLAAIFQSASARSTGTATFNLAEVNPAVQFGLLVMMYISVYPIAISVRASNTYEEKSLGIYSDKRVDVDEQDPRSYLVMHLQNQLSFDLWYIFFGIFCITIAEEQKIADPNNPAINVFSIFFEVVSAYANVGLSLGHPSVLTSLSGKFTPFSKLILCAMMIRGRHRGLPYQLDRAILLPNERLAAIDDSSEETANVDVNMFLMKRHHTQ